MQKQFTVRIFAFISILSMLLGAMGMHPQSALAAPAGTALSFNGNTNDKQHVTFGAAPGLGVTTFTLEAWVKRASGGAVMSTGSLGFDNAGGRPNIYPVVTKGMGEGETPANVNMNYFLGITATGFVGADFEDKTGGVNHPAWGTTAIPFGEWHHIAATYSGTCWALYVDGNLETLASGVTSCPNATPESISIQHAGLAAALNSTGTLGAGFFSGSIDEARVWNRALSQGEIQTNRYLELTSGSGLLARWGMNEGSGTEINSSVGSFTGTIKSSTTTMPIWSDGFPLPDITPPAQPTGLTATPYSGGISLSWVPNIETDLAGYNLYRSTVSGGAYTKINTAVITAISYIDSGLTNGTTYYYVLKAIDTSTNESSASLEVNAAPDTIYGSALKFDGVNDYVTFGVASSLGATAFTLESWFNWEGGGATANTGSGGVTAYPLITKGLHESDGSNVDANYFFGITTDGKLTADFEAYAGGQNYPIAGTTIISTNIWHHAAVTYTGNCWQLYLDGNPETMTGTSCPNQAPRYDSIQHAGIGTAMNSTGVTEGAFKGTIDEVRIWNVARSQTQILATMNNEVTGGIGLIGRWGMNEGSGTTIVDSTTPIVNGTLTNEPLWVSGKSLTSADITPPAAPSGLSATPGNDTVSLTWDSNAESDLAGYNVYRSATSPVTKTTPINGLLLSSPAYTDTTAIHGSTYYYAVTAVDTSGNESGLSSEASATPTVPPEPSYGLQLDGTDDYVTFGNPTGLGVTTFTIETWFNWTGGGTTASTGNGGVVAIPLIAKGLHESDGGTMDANFFLGISSGKLAADFEDYATGANHPITGVASISTGTWHHAAVTYDGQTWKLYLDGNLDNSLSLSSAFVPRYDSIQKAGIGAAMDSGTTVEGRYAGKIDEARIWNVARTQAEIRNTINQQLTSGTGLVARWGMGEGSGMTINSSVGMFPGTLTNGPTFVAGAPFNLSFDTIPPAAPSGLFAIGANRSISLDWNDNTDFDLAGYNIYRGTVPGTYTKVNQNLVTTSTYSDTSLTNGIEYYYVVRAVDTSGNESTDSNETYGIPQLEAGSALSFTSDSNTYVTFGDPDKLDLATFTIETWFKRTGAGTSITTGGSGIANAIPLVTHGAQQSEGSTVDANWMLVIDDSTDVIAADFEDMASGLNHPVLGVTPITENTWHHAAATYDGTTWKLYLDGKLENTVAANAAPRSDTIQHAALGTMLNTTGGTNGFFRGVIDEARVWNRALTQTEILTNLNHQLTSGTGLVARWGLNEGTGNTVGDSVATAANGTITGSNFSWVPGAPFDLDLSPDSPTLISPADTATNVPVSVPLTVHVSDARNSNLTVSFYGREKGAEGGQDFTLVAIPDPQYYASSYPSIYNAQMNWVVNNKTPSNIKYVMSLGDNVNTASTTSEWTTATTAWDILSTGNVPYGLTLGNHDGAPSGTGNYNAFFGSRISGQPTYGGRYGTSDYDNTYATFSASGMNFIVLFIEYDTTMTSSSNPVLVWADSILAANLDRRAIVVTHNLLEGNSLSAQGQAIYDALKDQPNLFLMLGGHLDETGQNSFVYEGRTVYALRSDYQFIDNQQSGYLRIMRFSPTDDMIYVTTYSPNQGVYRTINNNAFNLPYNMDGAAPFSLIGSTSVSSGADATVTWSGLSSNKAYEWYAVADNGGAATVSPTWSFTTEATTNHTPVITEGTSTSVTMSEDSSPTAFNLTLHATDADAGDLLTWSIATPAPNGNASTAGTGSSRAIEYTPNGNFNGSDSFVVQVSDGKGGTDTITVNVTIQSINDAPTCADRTITTNEDVAGQVAPSCIDVDGNTLTYTVTQPVNGNATVVTGNLVYTPSQNFNGSDTFTYKANDGATDSNIATVNVSVNAVNDAPVLTNPGSQNNPEGSAVSLQVIATDVDLPAQTLTYSAISLPDGLAINTTTGLISGMITYRAASSSPFNVTVSVTDGLTPAQQSFTWTVTQASSNLCGSDPNLVACWPMEEGSGSLLIDATSFGNDGSIIGGPTWVAGKNGQALKLSGTGQYALVPDSNTLDLINGLTMSAWIKPEKVGTQNIIKKTLGTATTNGYEISLSSGGKVFVRINGSATYRIDSITSYPTNGTTWMHISATYDGTTIRLYINGVEEGNKPGIAIGTNTTNLGLGAEPAAAPINYFQGVIDDARVYNRALSAAEIQALSGNHPPEAVGDIYDAIEDTTLSVAVPGVLMNDSDVDGNPFTAIKVTNPAHGTLTLNSNGSFTYTPAANYFGPDSFTYKANDGMADSNTATASIMVASVNDLPTADSQSVTTDKNVARAITLTGSDLETASASLVFAVVDSTTHGTLSGTAPNVTYQPDNNYSGPDSFTFKVNDGTDDSAPATVSITVNGTNAAPVLGAIGNKSVDEASLLSFTASATDVDGDTLTFSLDAGAPSGASINSATGEFTFAPTEAQGPGSYPMTVRVSDGTLSDSETINVTVNEVNQNPSVTTPGNQSHAEGSAISLQINASDTDIPANTLTYAATNLPLGLSINASTGLINGTVDYNAAASSPYAVTVSVTDGVGGSAQVNFSWTISDTTPPPTGLTCTDLNPKPWVADFDANGIKPQSRVWHYDNTWWAVFATDATGASAAGTWLWKLQGTTWTEVLKLSDATGFKPDVKSSDNLVHVLLVNGSSSRLVSVEYNAGTYQFWTTRPTPASISLNSEVATIDIDSTGRMWLATVDSATAQVVTYYSDSPYTSWNQRVVLGSGVVANDDISVVTAMPNAVGVLWSNQNSKLFGFRVHQDGADPSVWGIDEQPAAGTAHNSVGAGMADDHMNVKVATDGTLYATVKTSYDTTGFPKIALMVRHPNGSWDPDLYPVSESGTRPNIELDPANNILTIIYTSSESYNPIVYKQSNTGTISFGSQKTLRSGAFNDVSSTKQNYSTELVTIFHSSSQVAGELCYPTQTSGADLVISKFDNSTTARLNETLTYTIQVRNNGPQSVNGATVVDVLPSTLTNASWTCSASSGASCAASGTGNINDTVNLPLGATVTYSLSAKVSLDARGTIANTATIAPPTGISDPIPSNNSSTDTDTIIVGGVSCESDPTLVGCWPMEEGSGAALIDGSSFMNDAGLYGSPVWASGKNGNYALDLNGTSQYALVPADASLDLTKQVTVAVWAKPERYLTQDLIKKAANGVTDGFELSLAATKADNSSQRPFFRINQRTNGDTYRINASTMYPIDGTWMHIAATYDGTTMKLYINGVLEGSITPPAGTVIASNNLPLTIGAEDGTTASRFFQGWMDDVRVYNRALSATEIMRLAGLTPTYTLSVGKTGAGSGTISSNPTGIVCGTTCSYSFNENTVVTLTAMPVPGSTFTGWNGEGCSGTGTCIVTMDAARSVTANFDLEYYTLTTNKVGNGTITADPVGPYLYGDVVTLTATPDAGWSFSGWSANVVNGKVTINGNTSVTATFTQDTYALTVNKVGNGSVTANPAGPYHYGDVVVLSEIPDAGWSFGGWSSNVVDGKVTVNANTTVTATFLQDEYTLTIISTHGSVTKTPDQATYHYGDVVTLGVTADSGWSFINWTPSFTDNKVTITGNTTVTANYSQNEYTLSVNVVGSGSVSKEPDQASYHHGEVVTLTATPDAGWSFTGWSTNVVDGKITITGNTTVTASFTANEYDLTVNIVGNGSVTKDPDKATYHYGDIVTLTATPDAGWSFASWSSNVVGGKITINGNTVVTATFTEDLYTLTINRVGNGTVTADPVGPYHDGAVVTLSAIPDAGWSFAGWSANVLDGKVTINGNTVVTATFIQNMYTLTISKTGAGAGTITSAPSGIDCGTSCSFDFAYSSVVTLTAIPAIDSTFTGWSGQGCSGIGTCQVTIDASKTITAEFSLQPTVPLPPTNLQARISSTAINLSWTNSSGPEVSGYNVYRSDSETGPYSKLNPSLVTTAYYQDTTAQPGVIYYYHITAVSLSGLESDPAIINAKRTIAFRSSSYAENRGTSELTLATPSGVVEGDLLLAVISVRGAPKVTYPTGWAIIRNDLAVDNTIRQVVYYKFVSASEPPSQSWTFSSRQAASGGIVAYSGVDPVNPISASSGQINESSTSYTAPSVAANAEGSLLVGLYGISINAVVTPPSGMLEQIEIAMTSGKNKVTTELSDEILATVGESGNRIAIGDKAALNIGQLVMLLPAQATPPTDTVPPTIPQNLAATAVSPTQVDLTWYPATDNIAVAGYSVYRDGLEIGTATVTRYSDITASPKTHYFYTVEAFDDAGNQSGPSQPSEVTTPDVPPVTAIQFRAASTAGTQSAATILVINRPATAVSGDLLLASIDIRDGATITPPSGWSQILVTHAGTSLTKVTYYRVASVGEPASYVWTFSTAETASGIILAYSGVDVTNPIVAAADKDNTKGLSITAPSVNTNESGTVLVAFYGIATNANITPPPLMTECGEVIGSSGKIKVASETADENFSGVGSTGSRIATASKAEVSIGHLIALRPARP